MEQTGCAHGDVRPSNIAFRKQDGLYCLIDFDMCSTQIRDGCSNARILWGVKTGPHQLMMFTIGQIALVVFEIEAENRDRLSNDLLEVQKLWLENPREAGTTNPRAFQEWVLSKNLAFVFPDKRASDMVSGEIVQAMNRDTFDVLLADMLGVPSQLENL